MSEVTITPNADTTDAPKRAPRKSSPTGKIEHSAAIAAYARAHPKDPSAKGMRRVLRANKDADPAYKKHVKNAPWPAHQKGTLAKLFASDAAFVRELSRKRS